MPVRNALALVACLAIAASAAAQRSKLTVGDNAPGIDIETWFNGDAVSIEPGQVYVVEFWATWCAPCRKSIPHINELSQKYAGKGLRVIGVSSDDKSTDIVQKFVVSQGDRMSYLVGVDRKGNTKKAWMEAAGQNGIPCAFVVDRGGKVVFIGHPLDEQFERAVKMTLRGKFDPKKEKQAEPLLAAAERAVRVKNYREAYKYFDEVIAMDPVLFSRVAQRKFQVMLVDENDPTRAWAYAKQMLQTYSGDPETLRDAAVDIATNPLYKEPDLDIALAAAEAALAIQGTSNADALATVALVRFHRNELDQAVERQMQAWMVAVPAAKDDYKRTLEKYRSAAERTAKLN